MASVMEKVRPHAVAFMIGANDTQSVWTADGWIRYGTQEWEDAYGRRVGKLMDIMLDRGARRIYWVGMPIMRDSWRNRRMRLINRICRAQAQQRSGVRYVDIWALFCDTDGHYLAKWRGSDGVHFSLSGAQRLGKRVFRFVKADWLAADTTPSPAASSSATAAPSTSAST